MGKDYNLFVEGRAVGLACALVLWGPPGGPRVFVFSERPVLGNRFHLFCERPVLGNHFHVFSERPVLGNCFHLLYRRSGDLFKRLKLPSICVEW